jgi:hypothetical protein
MTALIVARIVLVAASVGVALPGVVSGFAVDSAITNQTLALAGWCAAFAAWLAAFVVVTMCPARSKLSDLAAMAMAVARFVGVFCIGLLSAVAPHSTSDHMVLAMARIAGLTVVWSWVTDTDSPVLARVVGPLAC